MPQGGKNNAPHKGKKTPQGGKNNAPHKGKNMPKGGKVVHKGKKMPQWLDIDKVKFNAIAFIWKSLNKDVEVKWRPLGDDIDFEYDESDVIDLEKCLRIITRCLPEGCEIKVPICGGQYYAVFKSMDGKLTVKQVNAAKGQEWRVRHMERSAVHVG